MFPVVPYRTYTGTVVSDTNSPTKRLKRWEYLYKIFGLMSIEMLLSTVAGCLVTIPEKHHQMMMDHVNFAGLYVGLIIWLGCAGLLVYYYHQLERLNYLFFGFFLVAAALLIGATCGVVGGKTILVGVALSFFSLAILTLYMRFIAKRTPILSLWGPFIFVVFLELIISFTLEFFSSFYPESFNLEARAYGCSIAIAFTAYILLGSNSIIHNLFFKEHLWGMIALHFELINLGTSVIARVKRSAN